MLVSIIVAMDERRGIGVKGRLPWHLPADLKRFKHLTMSHHLIMGRKTFESIGKPLPGRTTIVVTRRPSLPVPLFRTAGEAERGGEGLLIAHSLEDALAIARERGESEVFICGGGEIYAQSMPFVDRIYLTLVSTVIEADVYFPDIVDTEWDKTEVGACDAGVDQIYPVKFFELTRKVT